MPVAYPFSLRTFIREGKSRSQPASFRVAQPRRGFGYVDPVGTDTPVFWDVTFRFDRCDAIRFRMWFVIDLQRGVLDFTIPVRTEFGLQTYTLRFLDDALMDTREIGEIWEYKARVMARAEIIPAAAVTAYAAGFSGPIPDQYMPPGVDLSIALAGYWTAGVGPYTYAVVSGSLPPGVYLNEATGVVSGRPTAVGEWPGIVFERRDVFCAEFASNAVTFQNVAPPVTALLHFDGPNGSTVFTDVMGGSWGRLTAPYDGAVISTAQSRFGGASLELTNDVIVNNSPGPGLALTGDFTIEGWVRLASAPTVGRNVLFYAATTTSQDIVVQADGTSIFLVYTSLDPDLPRVAASSYVGRWAHWFVGVAGSTKYVGIDGNIASAAKIGTAAAPTGVYIGGTASTDMWIDELRVTKGFCRYTGSTYTVPTAEFPNP